MVLSNICSILSGLLGIYLFVLMIRVVIDWIQLFARGWRPKGVVLVIANAVYALTDPPLKALGRVIPVLRAGGVGLDLGFLVLWFGIVVVQQLLGYISRLAY